jgi:hypothetical protein
METMGNEPLGFGSQDERREQEMKDKAGELAEKATQKGAGQLESQKDEVSRLLEKVADAIEDDPLGRHAAGYARRGAEALRGRSARELLSQAGEELRHRPGATLAACLLAGFTLARMARR